VQHYYFGYQSASSEAPAISDWRSTTGNGWNLCSLSRMEEKLGARGYNSMRCYGEIQKGSKLRKKPPEES